MAPGTRSKFGAPMFEPEVFRKQIYCIEESSCDIVGTFRRPLQWFDLRGIVSPCSPIVTPLLQAKEKITKRWYVLALKMFCKSNLVLLWIASPRGTNKSEKCFLQNAKSKWNTNGAWHHVFVPTVEETQFVLHSLIKQIFSYRVFYCNKWISSKTSGARFVEGDIGQNIWGLISGLTANAVMRTKNAVMRTKKAAMCSTLSCCLMRAFEFRKFSMFKSVFAATFAYFLWYSHMT